ncbi:hypothetical protein [Lactobacillus sp.]|uniref:hypothetical protein n=1 Tax=Lactobacillus sp. TaxID=1591 RepID=UPI0019AF189F|nr:hypothetical protein [Lactobacillus sp.]MBD5430737.1 hypothetical protein [Lactobacillus sp.]
MKIKVVTSADVEIKNYSNKKDTDQFPQFYSDIELMVKAVADCENQYGDKCWEFFTKSDVKGENVNGVLITKIKWLRQIVLVCADNEEELSKFKKAFNQVVDKEWEHEYLDEKIKNLDIKIPDNHKNLKKSTLRDVSTFDFGNGWTQMIKNQDTDNNIYITGNEGPRYFAITANNVFWMDPGLDSDQSAALVKTWEKYKN